MDAVTKTDGRIDFLLSIGEEITTKNELTNLLNAGKRPLCYDGFEPSGRMHIAQGLLKTLFVKKMTEAGCDVIFWVADWFAQMNNKINGDITKIRIVGKYMIEIWKACGMPLDNVEFVWASESINNNADEYWALVMDICSTFSITRLKRCTKIMGRGDTKNDIDALIQKARGLTVADPNDENENENLKRKIEVLTKQLKQTQDACKIYEEAIQMSQNESMPTAYLLYAAMQCADIYFLRADICQLGMDQRKVNVLAREYHDHLFAKKSGKNTKQPIIKFRPKPIIISHHMLMGLKEGQEKMSKSDPDSAIFMEDSVEDVNRKIKKAFCRPKEIKGNPIMDYFKHIIFPYMTISVIPPITIDKKEWGGMKTYDTYEKFEKDYIDGLLHPSDIKPLLTREINKLLEPVRMHFKENEEAKSLLEQVKKFNITK